MSEHESGPYHTEPLNRGAPPTQPGEVQRPPSPSSQMAEDAAIRVLLPVGRTPLSIVAGYMGIFAILLPLAPLAIILGVIAVWDIKRRPGARGMGRAIFAIVMGVSCTALMILAIVAAAAGP